MTQRLGSADRALIDEDDEDDSSGRQMAETPYNLSEGESFNEPNKPLFQQNNSSQLLPKK